MKFLKIFVFIATSALASSAFAANFTCSDYYRTTVLEVTYSRVSSENVQGTFTLRSSAFPGGTVAGTFHNYSSEPDNYALENLDCSQQDSLGYCTEQSGRWLSAGGGKFNLSFGILNHATVACQGEVP